MKKETVYTDGAATLYHADFLDAAGSIQDNSIDFVFTDPPFELTGGGMKHSKVILSRRRNILQERIQYERD